MSRAVRHDPDTVKLDPPRRLPSKAAAPAKTAGTVNEGRTVDWRRFAGEPRTLGGLGGLSAESDLSGRKSVGPLRRRC